MKRPNDRSILVALDLSKAFDMVSHDKLLDDVFNSMPPNQLKRWLLAYMTERQSYVEFRGVKSPKEGSPNKLCHKAAYYLKSSSIFTSPK